MVYVQINVLPENRGGEVETILLSSRCLRLLEVCCRDTVSTNWSILCSDTLPAMYISLNNSEHLEALMAQYVTGFTKTVLIHTLCILRSTILKYGSNCEFPVM